MKNQTDTSKLSASYDYKNQAWIAAGKYLRCAHPDALNCNCYGKLHEGKPAFGPIYRRHE